MFRFRRVTIHTIIFYLIIIIATILRLWNLWNMHLSNDELSALSRIMYPNIRELFAKGIIPDGHPALTQIFLYLYAPLVEYNDFLLKLPFIIAGIVSIIVMYKAVKTMAGDLVALASIAFFSISQPFVYYSQLARPYAFGILEIALTMYFVTKIIYSTQKPNPYALFQNFETYN